jgi:isopenicillin N synthase-like dioxygenase
MVGITDAPVLRLKAYKDGGTPARQEFVDGLAHSFREYGFGKVTDILLDKGLVRQVFRDIRTFHESLSETQRRPYDIGGRGQRGYSGQLRETNQSGSLPNLQTHAMWGPDGKIDERGMQYPPNINPSEIPGARERVMQLYGQLQEQEELLYTAVAESLGIDPRYFAADYQNGEGPAGFVRTLHYPKVTSELLERLEIPPGATAYRSNAHADINRLTQLLLEGLVGDVDPSEPNGLELLMPDGETWAPALSDEPVMWVNVADTLSAEVDGIYPSTMHRVSVLHPEISRVAIAGFSGGPLKRFLGRATTHPEHPGAAYGEKFTYVYGQDVWDALNPGEQRDIGVKGIKILNRDLLRARLRDIGLYAAVPEEELAELLSFVGKRPQSEPRQPWEIPA